MPATRNLVPANGEAVEEEKVKAPTENELTALLDALPDQWRPFFTFLADVQRRYYRGRVALPKGRKK
jgi:hypothetical protein